MLTLFFSVLFACSDKPNSDGPDDQNDIPAYFNQSLVLVEADNFEPVSDTIEISFESVEPDEMVFQESQLMNFSGSCNVLFATYYLEDTTFVMTGLGSSYMLCEDEFMEEDQWLSSFFDSEPEFFYENGQVIFEGEDSTLVFEVAEATPDSDLVDTEWSVNGYETDGIAVGIMFDVAPSFVLHSDQSFTLETGCNSAMGSYEQSGDEIVVSLDSITDAICSDELSQEGEDLVLSVFDGSPLTVELFGPNLSLIHAAAGLTLTASAE